ncbi:uncharacterized protein [Argopecten irradians]|uniref:uncharacterized protein n=1 Tax=Argopecten irradians TaxID=31199 RepID=UPI00371848A3
MFRLLLPLTVLLFTTGAFARDKRLLMLFGHQFNNPGDMSNEFAGSTGGSSGSNAGSTGGNIASSGSQTVNGVPGDATHYLDNTHNYYHVISGGNAGYVQHAGNSGPAFSSQSASTGHGSDHLPGKCPWVGCSPACQDIDSVTGCVVCIKGCTSSPSGAITNGGAGSTANSGQLSGSGSTNTGTGAITGTANNPNTGSGNLNGVGNAANTGTANQNGGGNNANTGAANQNAVTTKPSTVSPTCRPFPANCPRGNTVIINGCPECIVPTTPVPTVHSATCPPTRCVAPCNHGVTLDAKTGCPVCVC